MDNGTEKGQENRMDNRKRLEELYDHIFAEGKEALARGGVVDSFLANPGCRCGYRALFDFPGRADRQQRGGHGKRVL